MKFLLDENNYYTGTWYVGGNIAGTVEIDKFPPYEEYDKQLACKYENETWIYDENKYQEIKYKEKQNETNKQIMELQKQLNDTDYKIIKSSEYEMARLEPPYNIQELHQERQELRDKINKLQG